VRGKLGGSDYTIEVPVTLPASEPRHDVLASLWARTRIEDLEGQDYFGIQQGRARPEVQEAITQLGLEYRLMTQFTSFVAVEEMIVTEGGQPHRVEVPVEMPEGVSYEGVFGPKVEMQAAMPLAAPMRGGFVGGVTGGLVRKTVSGPQTAQEAVLRDVARQWSPEEQKLAKLAPALRVLAERATRPGFKPTAEEAKFLRNGKVEVQVFLTDTSEATLKQLKELGFEVVLQPTTAKLVIGRLPVEKLAALAELNVVRYVAPR